MSILFVQGANKTATNTASTTLAYTSNVTSGNLLVAAFGYVDGATVSASLTDTVGSSWTTIRQVVGTSIGYVIGLAYGLAGGTGANTVTLTLGSVENIRFAIHEYSGVDTLDQSGVGQGTTGLVSAATDSPTTVANELVFGWMVSNSGSTVAGSGFTVRETCASEITEDTVVSATGTQTATSPDTSSAWVAAVATFYSSVAPPPAQTQPAVSISVTM